MSTYLRFLERLAKRENQAARRLFKLPLPPAGERRGEGMPVLTCVLALAVASATQIGCQRQATDVVAAGESAVEAPAGEWSAAEPRFALDSGPPPAGLTIDSPPEQIVAVFLDALRNGDSGIAEALLTRRARAETRQRQLQVRSIGSPSATFTVGTPRYLDAARQGAHVDTAWTEPKSGSLIHYNITWALRRQVNGWRVAGMGAALGPGQPVVYLDFEDPDEMLARWRAADEALLAAESVESGIRQAEAPSVSGAIAR